MSAPGELIVDLFAGGGGASQGIYLATGQHPDIAVNHDEEAVAVHARNHPETDHRCISVWAAEPREVCAGRPVGLLWASPDCVTTHDRFALVTVAGVSLPIVDIGMRMLAPIELARAQGFDDGYDLTDAGRLTKTAQVRLIGNSVCPPVAEAVIRSNYVHGVMPAKAAA